VLHIFLLFFFFIFFFFFGFVGEGGEGGGGGGISKEFFIILVNCITEGSFWKSSTGSWTSPTSVFQCKCCLILKCYLHPWKLHTLCKLFCGSVLQREEISHFQQSKLCGHRLVRSTPDGMITSKREKVATKYMYNI
jgi:hypothetical protein